VIVYAGKSLFPRHRNEAEVVAELAERNVPISWREVSLLGMKFIVYLALAHRRRAPEISADMQTRGGYICHLDATCEGGDPLLMSSVDSLSEIVLCNVKLPAEDEAHIVPFLQRIQQAYGMPVAIVHDMGKGILKAVATVFPKVPDFICHFHFPRDVGTCPPSITRWCSQYAEVCNAAAKRSFLRSCVMSSVTLQLELPKDWEQFRLASALDARLQALLDRQDKEGSLSEPEQHEAEALSDLVDMLALLRLRAERVSGQADS
jgi:hypothetical protein